MSDINIDDYFIFDGTYPSLAVDDEQAYQAIKQLIEINAEQAKKIEELTDFACSLQLSVGDDLRLYGLMCGDC